MKNPLKIKTSYFVVLWHWFTHLIDYTKFHTIKYMLIDREVHYYCDCGFYKPRRVYARFRT